MKRRRTDHSGQDGEVKGSHFLPKNDSKSRRTVINDEWQTAKESWAVLEPSLASYKARAVWQPFYYDGKCAQYLRELGFGNVIHEDVDFFERVSDPAFMSGVDLIWDNPPYTGPVLKERVLRSLFRCGKPFVVLLPSSVLFSSLLRELSGSGAEGLNGRAQIVLPHRLHVRKTEESETVPFKYMVWFCWDVGLPHDCLFL